MEALTQKILTYAVGLPEDAPLTAKALLHFGNRAAVDQALSRGETGSIDSERTTLCSPSKAIKRLAFTGISRDATLLRIKVLAFFWTDLWLGESKMRKVIGVVLAGGQSSRFGGVDKTFIPLAGRSLIAHAIERLAPQVDVVAISSNAPPDKFAPFGLQVFPDVIQGAVGPLGGIHAALSRWPDNEIATVAVDLPFLPRGWVQRLQRNNDGKPCAFLTTGIHHVLAIWWAPGVETDMQNFISDGGRSLKDWLQGHGQPVVAQADEEIDVMFNINTPGDLARAEQRLR